jgi:hypothetical protein
MIAQICLTTILVLFFLLAARNARGAMRWPALFFIFCTACGIVLVWQPEISNRVARWFGIGRGADLIFYFSLLFIFYALFLINLKIVAVTRKITALVRAQSLASPMQPEKRDDLERGH